MFWKRQALPSNRRIYLLQYDFRLELYFLDLCLRKIKASPKMDSKINHPTVHDLTLYSRLLLLGCVGMYWSQRLRLKTKHSSFLVSQKSFLKCYFLLPVVPLGLDDDHIVKPFIYSRWVQFWGRNRFYCSFPSQFELSVTLTQHRAPKKTMDLPEQGKLSSSRRFLCVDGRPL